MNHSFDNLHTHFAKEHRKRKRIDADLLTQITQEKELQVKHMQEVESKFAHAKKRYDSLLGRVADDEKYDFKNLSAVNLTLSSSIGEHAEDLRHSLDNEYGERVANVSHLLEIVTRMQKKVNVSLGKETKKTDKLDDKVSGWRHALRDSLTGLDKKVSDQKDELTGLAKQEKDDKNELSKRIEDQKEGLSGLSRKVVEEKKNVTKRLKALRDDLGDVRDDLEKDLHSVKGALQKKATEDELDEAQHGLDKQIKHVTNDFTDGLDDLKSREHNIEDREDHQKARLDRQNDKISDLRADVKTYAHDTDQLTSREKDDTSKLSSDLSYFKGHIEQEVASLKDPRADDDS